MSVLQLALVLRDSVIHSVLNNGPDILKYQPSLQLEYHEEFSMSHSLLLWTQKLCVLWQGHPAAGNYSQDTDAQLLAQLSP